SRRGLPMTEHEEEYLRADESGPAPECVISVVETEALEAEVEAEAVEAAQQVAQVTVSRGIRPLTALLLVMVCVSLLLHTLTIWRLLSLRNTLRDEIDQLSQQVLAIKSQQVRYDLPIDQSIPVNVNIPVRQSLDVPINTSVQIKQNIEVPIDT